MTSHQRTDREQHMHLRRQPGRVATAAVAVAVTAGALAASGTAHASPQKDTAPRFLSAHQLPPHPYSPWYAGGVTQGLPEFPLFCLEGALPVQGTSYRQFGTEYDTGAIQVTVRAANTGAARKLAAKVETSVRNCAADHLEQYPEATAQWRDYGGIDIEEGAHVYGIHTSHPDSGNDINLFGVGRDGRTVTVVKWSAMGTFDHAPVKEFRKTTRKAVAKLYR
ncbi:MAG TPA: hypothetical protein VFY14_07650 [Streptomyces sp.]|nr:hypothetical protein [Streptomyces sp.]